MDIIKSLEEKLIKDRKTLSEFQMNHINAVLEYLKDLKVDFHSAKKTYETHMRELER